MCASRISPPTATSSAPLPRRSPSPTCRGRPPTSSRSPSSRATTRAPPSPGCTGQRHPEVDRRSAAAGHRCPERGYRPVGPAASSMDSPATTADRDLACDRVCACLVVSLVVAATHLRAEVRDDSILSAARRAPRHALHRRIRTHVFPSATPRKQYSRRGLLINEAPSPLAA